MGAAESKNTKPVSKMTDEELFQALEEETDYFFNERNTSRVLGIWSKPLTEYIIRCYKANESLDKLYSLLDKYNTPYFIEDVAQYSFRVRFIRVSAQSAVSS